MLTAGWRSGGYFSFRDWDVCCKCRLPDRIGGGNNFRVCRDEEIALLSDADPGNDPPQAGCIYADQALIRPDTTTNYEVGLRRACGAHR